MSIGTHRSSIQFTIANGTSLSGVIDLAESRLIGIEMPATWTAASLTFQGSSDGVTFTNLVGIFAEIVVATPATGTIMLHTSGGVPSATVPTATGLFDAFPRFIKVRSGTSGAPVNQGGDRVLRAIMDCEA